MSDHEIRNHLRSALAAVVEAEQNRVSTILNNGKISQAQGIEMMKPVITLLQALKEEVGEVEGLRISTAPHGHMATVNAGTLVTDDSLSISANYNATAFVVEGSRSYRMDNSHNEYVKEYSSAEEVMARVLDVVGKHIGGQQAQRAYKKA